MTDDAPIPQALRLQALSDAVEFMETIDGSWVSWRVSEVEASRVPGSLGSHCLIFAREGIIRRVWHYPQHWRTLDAIALAALSCGR